MLTTLLIPNMHCPSCSSHISSLLEPFLTSSAVATVRTSLLDRTVTFEPLGRGRRSREKVVAKVAKVLKDEGGFEIEDPKAIEPSTERHKAPRGALWSRLVAKVPLFATSNDGVDTPTPLSILQHMRIQRHVDNCVACQAERQQELARGVRSSSSASSSAANLPILRDAAHPAFTEEQTEEDDLKVVVEKPRGAQVREVTLSVEGMTCSACTSSISAVLEHPAILSSDVDLLSASATVRYDGQAISKQDIREMIDDAGFECQLVDDKLVSSDNDVAKPTPSYGPESGVGGTMNAVTLSISGMTCSACSSAIHSALLSAAGVQACSISVLDASGTVHFDPRVISVEGITEAVKDVGYEAVVVSIESSSADGDGNLAPCDNGKGKGKKPEGPSTREIEVLVEGVFCRECTRKLDNHMLQLVKQGAVTSFTPFSLSRGSSPDSRTGHVARSTISYVPQQPHSVRSLIATLTEDVDEGFRASLVKLKTVSERAQEIAKKEQRTLTGHFLVALLFAIPTFIIAIVGMIALPMHDPFRMYWETQVWGAATRGTVALWPLATIVQFGVGRLFYARAWKSMKPHLRRPLNLILRRKTAHSIPITWRSFFSFGSMDLLVVLSTSTSYFASVAMMAVDVEAGRGAESHMSYFDSSTFLIMFILGGRALEAYAKSKTTSAVAALNALKPAEALLLEEASPSMAAMDKQERHTTSSGSSYVVVAADMIDIGDLILVRPGDLPPADGAVVRGETTFDESSLTGESRPVPKGVGDDVWTGTTNQQNAVTIRVNAVAKETMVERLISAMNRAAARKAPIAKIAEQFTAVFTPAIIYISIVVLAIWLGVSLSRRMPDNYLDEDQRDTSGRVFFSFQFAIAVLVVSCPCGAGLATPTAQAVGSGMTAKAGILTSGGGEAFQTTTNVSHVVLDKTGTITTGGSMLVTDVDWVEGGSSSSKASRNEILAAIRVAEAESSHPIGTALRAFAAEHLGEEPHAIQVVHIKEVPGRGLVATFSSAAGDPAPQFDLWLGNTEHMLDAGIPITADTSAMALQAEWEAAAKTVITVAICVPEHTPCVVARVAVADPPRKEAREVIKELRKGYQVWMLSGDSLPTALAVARQVGIADDHVIAGVLPEAKADHLEALQNRTHELVPRGNWSTLVHRAGIVKGRKRGVVMFVGDGLNDTVALKQADVAVAMSHGSQATLASADFVLLHSNLASILTLLKISKKVYNRQKLNLAWAFVFNVVCIPFAAGAFYFHNRIKLPPVWAALAMALSSTSVVVSSLALKWGL